MTLRNHLFIACCFASIACANAYEINNHADMSQRSAEVAEIGQTGNGKLARLGLRRLPVASDSQRFPLGTGLGPIPYCFGSARPDPWLVTIGDAGTVNALLAQPPKDSTTAQPDWMSNAGNVKLTIAQFIRYGACYEDEEHPYARSVTHFYNPQNGGVAAPSLTNLREASSLEWMLKPGVGTSKSGSNHYTWQNARNYFYYALTGRNIDQSDPVTDVRREAAWGSTFQALGHIVHHLQDMASPQHVRSDYHCNSVAECIEAYGGIVAYLPLYRPSGYETYFDQRFDVIKALAQSATAPMIFGLPREFWNVQSNNDLSSPSVSGHLTPASGLAAYTSTNFASEGQNFRAFSYTTGSPQYRAAPDNPYPQPSGSFNDVNVTELFNEVNLPAVRDTVCGGSTTNCVMRFMGTAADPAARTAALSTFSRELLVPRDPNDPRVATWTGSGTFQQNFFTYSDAAQKLVPRAVEYSAGLINYFFRGEMEISLPEEGVYGIVDHAVEKTKGSDGFRFIKMRVRNTTADIVSARGTLPQPMSAGQFVAVAKFRRNNCYTSDLKGQIGRVGRGARMIVNDYATCRTAVEEIVVSAPGVDPQGTVTELSAGAAREMSFDFSTNPIPIEATDLFLQVVFKGTLGEELGAVAVTTRSISEPSFLTNLDSFDVQPCATSEPGICRTITAPANTVDFSPCVPNDADARPCLRRGRNYGGRERYLGFNPDIAATRVVEWYGAKSDSIDALYFERDANNYYRVAVLADVELAPRTVTWSLADDSASKWIRQGDVPVVFGQFRQLTGTGATYIPTPSQLTPAYSRFPATRVKANVDDTAPTLDSLPQYAVVRGVVVGVDLDRTDDPDALPFLFNSPGDNVRWADWADGTLHPANRTLYERAPDLPGGASAQPVAVKAIRFGNTPAYRLPAPTTAELEDMASDIYQARYWQPRMVRTQGLPQGYHWSVQ